MSIKNTQSINPTKFLDSFNLIPVKLARFVETFGLEIPGIEGKQFFPFNYSKV